VLSILSEFNLSTDDLLTPQRDRGSLTVETSKAAMRQRAVVAKLEADGHSKLKSSDFFRRVRSPDRPHVRDDCRRVLALLAASPYGASESILLAHGFDQDLLVELVRDELVSVREDRVRVGNHTKIVFRLRITDTGRRMLASLKAK
jgi:hypothetical protein